MKVSDAMTRQVTTIASKADIGDAMRLMLQTHISGLPVVDRKGTLVGMLTEGDLLRRAELGTEQKHPRWLTFLMGPGRLAREYTDSHGRTVEEVMTPEVITIDGEAPLAAAVNLMEQRHIKRIPVVHHGRLEGILSRADLMRAALSGLPGLAPADTSDATISKRIAMEFDSQSWAPRTTAHADVRRGVVHLQGVILNDAMRDALRVLVESIPGVIRVEDELTTVEPMSGQIVSLPTDRQAGLS
ncbi:CBS domain-containing protein [Dyella koreensis]|uniref:CBS domain-containing protein n=1 Tax=Dyella koreensis TaxID=311235 RepID=A0ABW8KC87_9GAMM